MTKCCLCRTEFAHGGKTYVLTSEEKEAIGPTASGEVSYCGVCLKVITDRKYGLQVIRGLLARNIQKHGAKTK